MTALINPDNPKHFAFNIAYTINSVFMWALMIRTFFNEKKLQVNMEIVLINVILRNLIRIWDFEETTVGLTQEELKSWYSLVMY